MIFPLRLRPSIQRQFDEPKSIVMLRGVEVVSKVNVPQPLRMELIPLPEPVPAAPNKAAPFLADWSTSVVTSLYCCSANALLEAASVWVNVLSTFSSFLPQEIKTARESR